MSEKIVQLNEEVIKGQIKEWSVAAWKKPSLRCTLPASLCAVRKTLPRPCGAARYLRTPSVELDKKACARIEDWRNRPLQGGKYPHVYVDGIYLRRNWGGEYEILRFW